MTGPLTPSPPPRKLKTPGQPRVAAWGRHKDGLCAAWLRCPQDSGGGGRSRFPSHSASCGGRRNARSSGPAWPVRPTRSPFPCLFLGLRVELQTSLQQCCHMFCPEPKSRPPQNPYAGLNWTSTSCHDSPFPVPQSLGQCWRARPWSHTDLVSNPAFAAY